MIPLFGIACKIFWLAWLPSTAVVLWSHWRSLPLERRKGTRMILGLAWLLAALCVTVSYLLPAAISPPGIITLTDQTPFNSWKGLSGKALFQILSVFIGTDYPAAIALLRSLLFLAPPVIVSLILRQSVLGNRLGAAGSGHSGDSSPSWETGAELLPAIVALMLHSAFLEGPVGVRYFGFYPLLTGTFLLSLPGCFPKGGGLAVRVCLVSSLGLMGWSRPETLMIGLVLGGMALFLCWRHGDPALGTALLALVMLFLWSSAQSYPFVLRSLHQEGTILGKDMTPSLDTLGVGLVAMKRICVNILPNVFFLSCYLNVLGLLALVGAYQGLRRRTLSAEEMACVAVILVEFVLVSIKEDGFGGGKYESLIILPTWFLALSTLRPLRVLSWPRQSASRRMMLGTLLVTVSVMMLPVMFFDAHDQRLHDQRLLYFDAPPLARSLCSTGRTAKVLVVGMDERSKTSQASWESQRWPLGTIFCRAGCSVGASYPEGVDALEGILAGRTASSESSGSPMCDSHLLLKREYPPTHLMVTFLRPETRAALGHLLEMPAGRGWRLLKEFPQAAVLGRVLAEN